MVLPWPVVGLAALVWFVVRVVPRPSRASYPCQRVAAPLASGFVLWLLALGGSALAFGQARQQFRRARSLAGVLLLVLGATGIAGALALTNRPALAAYAPHPANAPMGIARGLAPGRVVWAYDRAVTDWTGPGNMTRWYEHVDQAVASQMLSRALQRYSGAGSDRAAWSAILRHFNGDTGYVPGEKVAIKINLVTANMRFPLVDASYNHLLPSGELTLDPIANSPQLLHALLDQLINVVGVAPADITVGDPTGLFVDYLYDPLHASFPGVHYLDNRGTLGRTRAEFGTVPFYWSTHDADGTTLDHLPTAFAEAEYLINFAVLKSHDMAGITVTAKNHFGSLLRNPDGYVRDGDNSGSAPYNGYYNMHASLPASSAAMRDMGHYRSLVDLMGHQELGGKTVLYLIDGIFGGEHWHATPSRWSMPPFDGDWPSSLFLSMDPVAIDSVARDFLSQQWPIDVLMGAGVEDYLHEAALANDPPSSTVYDPERDGSPMASLGVHEHWNNAVDKQYSRNLDTGQGIELLFLPPLSERLYLPLVWR